MNIFFVSLDAYEAAQQLCDKHVVKMIVESAQLLSTAHRVLDGDADRTLPDERESVFYKATHINHPCSIWTRTSVENYSWLVDHFDGLLKEYTHRYGKIHACHSKLFLLQSPPLNLKEWDMTPAPSCMPDDCKVGSLVQNYRTYYLKHKSHMLKWKNRPTPQWAQ